MYAIHHKMSDESPKTRYAYLMISLSQFGSQFPLKKYARNETIVLQGEDLSHINIIKSGFIKCYDIDKQGTEQLVWIGSPGDFFPVLHAFELDPRAGYFVTAFTDVQLYRVPRKEFSEFLRKNPETLYEVARQLAQLLNDSVRHLNAAEKAKADEKIAHTLYFLSLRFGNPDEEDSSEIAVPVTHQDIANLLGLTRETVTVELKRLKDKGYIFYDKGRFIVYRERLAEIL